MARESAPRFRRGDALSVSKLNRVAEMASRALDVQGPNLSVGSDGVRLRPVLEEKILAEITGNDGGTPPKHSWRAVVQNADGTLSNAEPVFTGTTTVQYALGPGGAKVGNNTLVYLKRGRGEWYESERIGPYLKIENEVNEGGYPTTLQFPTFPNGAGSSLEFDSATTYSVRLADASHAGMWGGPVVTSAFTMKGATTFEVPFGFPPVINYGIGYPDATVLDLDFPTNDTAALISTEGAITLFGNGSGFSQLLLTDNPRSSGVGDTFTSFRDIGIYKSAGGFGAWLTIEPETNFPTPTVLRIFGDGSGTNTRFGIDGQNGASSSDPFVDSVGLTFRGGLFFGGTFSASSGSIADFTEAAQDAAGATCTNSARVSLTYNDGTGTITPDLVSDTITAGYLHASATDILFGRSTAGGGPGEEIPCTSFGRSLLAAADAAVGRTALALGTLAVEDPATDIGALTDNTSGSADQTLEAITDPADAPTDADALRDDLVANALPAIRNNLADLAAQCNSFRTALQSAGIML